MQGSAILLTFRHPFACAAPLDLDCKMESDWALYSGPFCPAVGNGPMIPAASFSHLETSGY